MIVACPNKDIFTDWQTIFMYINGIRESPQNQNHIKNLCHIVIESVKILNERINDENESDADRTVNQEKLMRLVKLLPSFLRHFETNREIIGELLFVYQHINLDMLLREPVIN